jgi:putative membrane protein
VVDLVIKVLVNAAALWVAVQVVPQIDFAYGDDLWKLIAVAVIFALVNTFLRPIVKLLSLPITVLTLGLIGFVINAAMLMVTALISDVFDLGFRIDEFPPNLTVDAIIGAFIAALVITVVSTALSLVRKIV